MTEYPLFPDDDSLAARFAAFLADQPDVYPLFCRLAREVRAKGYRRYSADAIVHRIRWHFNVERGRDDFKINDHYRAPMARKLEGDDPSFVGFFENRGGGQHADPNNTG